MSRYESGLERALADGLEPVNAPESLWYRVDAELSGRQAASWRRFGRLALAFGVVLVGVISVGWYLDRPTPQSPSANRPAQVVRSHNSCVMCHV